jgi:hypothetical protein
MIMQKKYYVLALLFSGAFSCAMDKELSVLVKGVVRAAFLVNKFDNGVEDQPIRLVENASQKKVVSHNQNTIVAEHGRNIPFKRAKL